ncbi:B12-binding domain-containing radical SAM protein [Thermoproteota archaeon]
MGLFPPTGLEYVSTSAKGLVDKITLLDLRYETALCDPQNLIDFIRKEIDIICVNVGWDRQYKEICGLLNMMPTDIPLVIGGYKATEQVQELFAACPTIDIIVRGEGEETIKEVLGGAPLESILGISYRNKDRVVHNSIRPLRDVNNIASPDRSLRRNDYRLKLNGVNMADLTFDSVLSARGCPFTCKFCTFSLNPLGQKRNYSARSVQSVIEEIEKLDAKIILFSDDNFFTNMKRSEEICDEIIKRNIQKRFIAHARIDVSKHPTLLEKMSKAGFKILFIGVESPHDRILAQIDKGFTSDDVRKAFSVLTSYPMYYHGYFIYGNIGETEEEMLYISQFAKEIGLDSITFHKLRIEKFSPLKEIAESTPGYHVTDRGELYSDMYSHASLKKIGRKIKFSFYRPSRLIRMIRKLFAIRVFTPRELLSFLAVFPSMLIGVIIRDVQKKRFSDSLKRLFVSNK